MGTADQSDPRTPKQAAGVIVLCDTESGPHVLLVERNPRSRFMGGAWVFPGGALESHESHPQAAVRELAEEASLKLDGPDELVAFSHWITPEGSPVRFDTRFFLARAPAQQVVRPDGQECVQAAWFAPDSALAANRRGSIKLVFPTIKQLEQLSVFSSVADAFEGAQNTAITPITPKIVVSGGTQRLVLPGELD